jgi:hypothetical protein
MINLRNMAYLLNAQIKTKLGNKRSARTKKSPKGRRVSKMMVLK